MFSFIDETDLLMLKAPVMFEKQSARSSVSLQANLLVVLPPQAVEQNWC